MKRTLGLALLLGSLTLMTAPLCVQAGGGGGGGRETLKVSKCFYMLGGSAGLIKASSTNSTAHLFAYLPSGELYGEVQNGGGSQYGGTVMRYLPADPITVTIISTAGATITVPTTPFQL